MRNETIPPGTPRARMPPDVAAALRRAAKVSTPGSPARISAINRAYEQSEIRYPELFRR
jgi:hypothetical protein